MSDFIPDPLTTDEVALLRETLQRAAPHLLGLVGRLEQNEVLDDDDVDALEDVLANEMTSDYTEEEGLTKRGVELADLIAICRVHASSFGEVD